MLGFVDLLGRYVEYIIAHLFHQPHIVYITTFYKLDSLTSLFEGYEIVMLFLSYRLGIMKHGCKFRSQRSVYFASFTHVM